MMDRLKVFTAKRKLYLALLELNVDDLTDDDIRLMESLSTDSEIQGYLQDAISSSQPNDSHDRLCD